MFVPDDLSIDEATLAETIRRQLRTSRHPRTPAGRRAAEREADQVVAETIQAARAAAEHDEETGALSQDEERWRRIRLAMAHLDGSSGSLGDLAMMEEQGETAGEWLPAGEPSRPSRS